MPFNQKDYEVEKRRLYFRNNKIKRIKSSKRF